MAAYDRHVRYDRAEELERFIFRKVQYLPPFTHCMQHPVIFVGKCLQYNVP